MALKTHFEDPSSRTGVFVGDLKYGRRQGKEFRKHNDFPAQDENGNLVNEVAVPLVLQKRRDPQVWNRGKTKVKKVKKNPQDLQDTLMMTLATQTGGLLHNLRVTKIGRQLSVLK